MTIFPRGRIPSLVSAILVSVLVTGAPLASGTSGLLTGRVFDADGRTPLEGVVVHLFDAPSSQGFPSETTGSEGAFRIADVPTGEYTLVAETVHGAYLAPAVVVVESGPNEPLSLALNQPTPRHQASGGSSGDGGSQAGGKKRWGKWIIAGAIAVVALFVVYEVTKDSEQDASTY